MAGWNIHIFNRKYIDSIRGPHSQPAMLDDPGVYVNANSGDMFFI